MERCELERIADMKTFLQEKKEFLLKNRIQKIKNTLTLEEQKNLENVLKNLVEDNKEGCLVISYLRSSYITESHDFYIAFYAGEPFVEEEPNHVIYSMSTYLRNAEEDRDEMCNELHHKFIRIMASEKEEIRRWYMEELYKCSIVLFKELLKNMEIEKNIEVYYGSYMDEAECIGRV